MFGKVKKVIEKYRMIRPGDRALVAVSGGPDSVALLAILHKLAPELGISLVVGHLNHGLRPEADAEERFVRELCLSMGLQMESARTDILELSRSQGKSVEDMARAVRYSFLDQTASLVNADRIALGHHLHDQAETVLMNLLRGSGPEGLKGMTPVRDRRYIRPLLYTSSFEIREFLAREGLSFAVDDSNLDPKYLRNRIRHELLPLLESQYKTGIERTLARTAEIIGREDDFMEDQVRLVLSDWNISESEDNLCLDISKLRALHEALACRIIKVLLERFSPDEKGVFFSHIQAVLDLAFLGKPSGRLNLPFAVEAKRDYGRLLLSRREEGGTGGDYCYPVAVPGRIHIPEGGMLLDFSLIDAGHQEVIELVAEKEVTKGEWVVGRQKSGQVYLDYDRLTLPLKIRRIHPGDRMRPFGMEGTKKLKAIFIDKKVAHGDRHRLPLLVDANGILWIVGACLNESVRITVGTRRVLKVVYDQVSEKSIEIRERLL
ncbi:MAG TPA: tRNA lysidine(34) synthetase TilS [Syntrophus sp. (in: bacteria)]|nr:tRNA lysidine(34) synthetase TilS [Syntrophus sp. (in: bacteria)]